nr:NUDIX hydrolase [Lachnospiraceae bacterium]
ENKNENLEWEEVSCEHLVNDQYVDFRRQEFRLPNGEIFGPYYTYSRKNYIVVVALDEEGRYICVRQFRQGIMKVTTEFCAGGIERSDKDSESSEYPENNKENEGDWENALSAAKRELREETGYESDDWKHLITMPSNATVADNYAHIYLARNCRKVTGQDLDDTEFLNVIILTEEELEERLYSGNFEQAVHVMAWLLSKKEK